MKIRSDETVIVGGIVIKNGKPEYDSNSHRILKLTADFLVLLGRSEDGWSALYCNPDDGRLWELTYEHSNIQGGGAPSLREISRSNAILQYGAWDAE